MKTVVLYLSKGVMLLTNTKVVEKYELVRAKEKYTKTGRVFRFVNAHYNF